MSKNNITIEIKESKTGHPVPVINGVHLHSSYNPTKEAEAFVEKYNEQLESCKYALVLGLGFAYHIDRILYQMRKHWGEEFRIVVIDPTAEIEASLKSCRNIDYGPNVSIYSGLDVSLLYSKREIVDFLAMRPTVIAHTASFNLFNGYYKSFMSFQSKVDLFSIAQNVQNPEFKKYLLENHNTNYFEFVNKVNSKSSDWNKWDFLVMALDSIAKPENTAPRENNE